MKPLDKVNTPNAWWVGFAAVITGVATTTLTNPQAVDAIFSLFQHPTPAGVFGAIATIAGVVAVAVGKPPATS